MRLPTLEIVLSACLLMVACTEAPTAPVETAPEAVLEPTLEHDVNNLQLKRLARLLGGAKGNPCGRGPHRDMDFWRGRWDLTNPDGSFAAWHRIKSGLNRCVLAADFQGSFGFRGRSLNAYDRATDSWIQSYMDEFGAHFRIRGGLVGETMVMTGDRLFLLPSGNLFPVVDRVNWTPGPKRTVLQTLELSVDGGATFPFVTADFIYDRARPFNPDTPVGNNACEAAEYDALDAWLGDWKVSSNGRRVGRATVSQDLSNCLLEIRFRGSNGYKTRSFIAYDFTTESWHRTYVDNRGSAFRIEGDVSGSGEGTLTGMRPRTDGAALSVSNTFRSTDEGLEETWIVDDGSGANLITVPFSYSRR